jgi:hypothetical protein
MLTNFIISFIVGAVAMTIYLAIERAIKKHRHNP